MFSLCFLINTMNILKIYLKQQYTNTINTISKVLFVFFFNKLITIIIIIKLFLFLLVNLIYQCLIIKSKPIFLTSYYNLMIHLTENIDVPILKK